jgi:tRNA(Ile)-lysidine synthase
LTASHQLPGSLAPVAVAYSGGADSTALLMMCAGQFPGQVCAVHVHHGLQAAADDFAEHARLFCERLNVPFACVRVDARAAAGESPEDAARRARYKAISSCIFEQNRQFARMESAQDAIKSVVHAVVGNVALAQHADDQVETMLLALSRGAGLPGLSAMPAVFEREGLSWHRPLLNMTSRAIRDWLATRGLKARHPGSANLGEGWVEDPTNQDTAFTRNRIRAQLMPALEAAFPQFRETFARSASHAAQAQLLLDQVAVQDLQATDEPPQIKALQALSRERQANALRRWLKSAHQIAPSAAQLAELLDQIAACTTRGHQIRIKIANGFMQRQGDALEYLP